jgi:hypothetical protein
MNWNWKRNWNGKGTEKGTEKGTDMDQTKKPIWSHSWTM